MNNRLAILASFGMILRTLAPSSNGYWNETLVVSSGSDEGANHRCLAIKRTKEVYLFLSERRLINQVIGGFSENLAPS